MTCRQSFYTLGKADRLSVGTSAGKEVKSQEVIRLKETLESEF